MKLMCGFKLPEGAKEGAPELFYSACSDVWHSRRAKGGGEA